MSKYTSLSSFFKKSVLAKKKKNENNLTKLNSKEQIEKEISTKKVKTSNNYYTHQCTDKCIYYGFTYKN